MCPRQFGWASPGPNSQANEKLPSNPHAKCFHRSLKCLKFSIYLVRLFTSLKCPLLLLKIMLLWCITTAMQSAKQGSSQAEAEPWFLGLEAASSPMQGRVGAAGEGGPLCIAPLGQRQPTKLGPQGDKAREAFSCSALRKNEDENFRGSWQHAPYKWAWWALRAIPASGTISLYSLNSWPLQEHFQHCLCWLGEKSKLQQQNTFSPSAGMHKH